MAIEAVEESTFDHFQTDTLTGDIRDAMLDRIKHAEKPWEKMSETEQQGLVASIGLAAEFMVRRAVQIIAADDRPSIPASIEQFTIKDGVKAVMKLSATDDNILSLNHARSVPVLIVVADPQPYTGEQAPAEVDADEPPLFDETAAGREEIAQAAE